MNTFEKIRELTAQYKNIDPNLIKPESTLDELEMDSLDMFQVIFEAEEIFNIEVDFINANQEIKTIQDVVNLIGDKI